MVIVDSTRFVVGGVDTHRDVNVGAVVDMNGGLLGVESFPTNADGHRCLSSWMSGFGRIERVGIEVTGAYGAGVARHFVAAGVAVKIMTIDQANVSLNVLRDTGSKCRTVIPSRTRRLSSWTLARCLASHPVQSGMPQGRGNPSARS